MPIILGSVGDIIGSNFKVLDRITSTIEEGRVVRASFYSQPFIPTYN